MAYTPTSWSSGDVVTSEKLNKIEDGIENATMVVVNVSYADEAYRADATIDDIEDAISDGKTVIAKYAGECYNLASVSVGDSTKSIVFATVSFARTTISIKQITLANSGEDDSITYGVLNVTGSVPV